MTAPTANLNLADYIRDIPDFPKPGIMFKDICPLLKDPAALRAAVDQLTAYARTLNVDLIVGIESRGFILGAPVAYQLGKGFIPVRKPGKLPYQTEKIEYSLEYGSGQLEIHADALGKGTRVLVVDDLLATGGTVGGTRALIERLGATVAGVAFVIELEFLNGREKLAGLDVFSILKY